MLTPQVKKNEMQIKSFLRLRFVCDLCMDMNCLDSVHHFPNVFHGVLQHGTSIRLRLEFLSWVNLFLLVLSFIIK